MSLFIAIDPLPVEPEMTVEDVPTTDAYDNSIGKSQHHTIWGGSVLDLSPFYK
jgi:hypothetical protein